MSKHFHECGLFLVRFTLAWPRTSKTKEIVYSSGVFSFCNWWQCEGGCGIRPLLNNQLKFESLMQGINIVRNGRGAIERVDCPFSAHDAHTHTTPSPLCILNKNVYNSWCSGSGHTSKAAHISYTLYWNISSRECVLKNIQFPVKLGAGIFV